MKGHTQTHTQFCTLSPRSFPVHNVLYCTLVKYLICCFSSHSIRSIFHLLNNGTSSNSSMAAWNNGHNSNRPGNIEKTIWKYFRYNFLSLRPSSGTSAQPHHCLQQQVNIWHSNQNVSTAVHSPNLFIYTLHMILKSNVYYICNQNFPPSDPVLLSVSSDSSECYRIHYIAKVLFRPWNS